MSEPRTPGDWRRLVRDRLGPAALSGLRPEREADVVEELASLLEEAYEEGRGAGHDPRRALDRALSSVGDWRNLAERVTKARPRDHALPPRSRGGSTMTDLRTSLRSLARNPGFTLAACAVLALGIGANVAIFSVVHGVLLAPLPYPDPDRLGVVVVDALGRQGIEVVSASNVIDVTEQSTTISEMAIVSTFETDLELDGRSVSHDTAFVTANLLDLLGLPVLEGRSLDAGADTRQNGLGNVLVSERFWRERFGADPDLVGRTLRLNEQDVEVVGVLAGDPQLLISPGVAERIDLWSARPLPADRGTVLRYRALVRLVPGASLEAAGEEIGDIYRRTHALDYADEQDLDIGFRVLGLEDHLLSPYRRPLMALLGAVGCVLLLMCANLANLLLVRGLHRRGEWAVRSALGASRIQLLRLGLVESLLLATAGGAAGVAIAVVGTRALLERSPLELPRMSDVGLDLPVLAFAIVASIASALIAGLVPAWRIATEGLRSRFGDRGGGGGVGRTGRLLGAFQMAIAVVLLAAAGLMLRTLDNLLSADLGWETVGRYTFSLSLPREVAGDDARRLQAQRALIERLEQIPGVESASFARTLPLASSLNLASFAYDRETEQRFGELTGSFHRVFPGYFRTMGMPILAGRDFERADTDQARDVVLVSAAFAAEAWPDRDPLRERVLIDFATPDDGTERRWADVVGVVPEVREETIESPFFPQVYLPYHPATQGRRVVLALSSRPIAVVGALDEAIADAAPGGEASDLLALDFFVDEVTAPTRFLLTLVGVFSLLALLLAALGVYGVIAHLVSTRRREIGVRVALGARRADVFGLVLRQGLGLAALGLAVGVGAALYLTRFLRSFLFEVAPGDPLSLGAVVVVLLVVAGAASALPARRAAGIDPNRTLRSESS